MSIKNVVRLNNWWYSKIPPLFAVAYLQGLRLEITAVHALGLLGCIFFSVVCVASYGHVINDIFDIEQDARAGKPNAMARRKPSVRAVISLTLLAAGFLPALWCEYAGWGVLILALNYLWPTIYSLPMFRLKERGIWGVFCDAAGSHVTPTLLVLVVFAQLSAFTPAFAGAHSVVFCVATIFWSCVLGVKGILNHQVADREFDKKSETVTFAVQTTELKLDGFLPWYNLCIESSANVLLVSVVCLWCPLALISLLCYVGVEIIKFRLGFEFALDKNGDRRRANIPFANDLFYEVWFPAAAALQLVLANPVWGWLLLIPFALFVSTFRVWALDLRAVGMACAASLPRWRTLRIRRLKTRHTP